MVDTFRRLFLGAMLLALAAPAAARGPWRANAENTQGWRLMSPEERTEHQARIRGFKTYEECEAYRAEHHRLMAERAKAQGMELGPGRRDICADLPPGRKAP